MHSFCEPVEVLDRKRQLRLQVFLSRLICALSKSHSNFGNLLSQCLQLCLLQSMSFQRFVSYIVEIIIRPKDWLIISWSLSSSERCSDHSFGNLYILMDHICLEILDIILSQRYDSGPLVRHSLGSSSNRIFFFRYLWFVDI